MNYLESSDWTAHLYRSLCSNDDYGEPS